MSYKEYPIVAGTPTGSSEYTHHLLRLATGGSSIEGWKRPLKLNRKDWAVIHRKAMEERQAVRTGNTLGGNGPEDEKVVKMDTTDTAGEKRDESLIAPGSGPPPVPRGGGEFGAGNRFKTQRKTRQIHIAANQAARLLRREEARPWLLEDANEPGLGERWVGEYEGSHDALGAGAPLGSAAAAVRNDAGGKGAGNGDYVIFRFSTDADQPSSSFEVVPCARTYRFTQRPAYDTLTAEEAATVYERMQKASTREDVGRWYMRQRNGATLPGATAIKREDGPGGRNQVASNGRRFRPVSGNRGQTDDLFGGDDDDEVKPRLGGGGGGGRREAGAEGEYDEFDFEEEFADDEEGAGNLNDEAMEEDELRELEERLKKEMMSAGRAGNDERMDTGRAHDEDEILPVGGADELSREGRATRKLLRKKNKDDVYDSDDSAKNPYASDEDESAPEFSDSDPSPSSRPPSVSGVGGGGPGSRSGTPHLPASIARPSHLRGGSSSRSSRPTAANSRSGTPVSGRGASPRPSGGGAGRAGSRSGTPQPGPGSRRDSRAVSPAPGSGQKRKLDPSAPGSSRDPKRASGASSLHLSTTTTTTGGAHPPADQGNGPIEEHEVVAFLKDRVVTTKDLLGHFRLRLRDERNKGIIQSLVKKVGQMMGGNVTLKEGYVAPP